MTQQRQPTQYQKRLFEQIQGITDETLREMICECLYLEYKYRSAGQFPIRHFKDIVDKCAGLLEGEIFNEI